MLDETEPTTRSALRAARRGGSTSTSREISIASVPLRPRPVVVAATVVTAGALGVAAMTSALAAVVAVVGVVGLAIVAGWPALSGSPVPRGQAVVLAITTVAVLAALLLAPDTARLEPVPAAIAVGIVAMCVLPLAVERARTDLSEGLAQTAAGIALIACAAPLVAVAELAPRALATAMIAVALTSLIDLLSGRPGIMRWLWPMAVVGGALGGMIAGLALLGSVRPWAILAGMLSASVALALRAILSRRPAIEGTWPSVACGAGSVLITGPVIYVLVRAMGGLG
ncbi:hypothetical protein [Janibacter sp. GXQ6167]|uniref:hypothetical protein n=1 Tax=Janibacter sp. GXQ6167 TaxID=3240791 RepID=UPI00352383EA